MQGKGFGAAGVLLAAALGAGLYAPTGQAATYDWDYFGGIDASISTSFSLGAQVRLTKPSSDIVGVANFNPSVCRSLCQPHLSTAPGDVPGRVQLGLEAEGNFVNQLGLDAPGAASINHDDGTLNYDQYDVTQAPFQINQDFELRFREDIGPISGLVFFARYNAFHDFVNYDREQDFPNFYTPEDRARDDARRASGEYGFPSVGTPTLRRTGDKFNEYLGQDIDLIDAYVSGFLPTAGMFGTNIGDLQFTIGNQTINWGESTLLVVNSLNTINPPNVNALFRPAFLDLATVFEPIGAIKIGGPLTLNTSFEIFYQYDWQKVEIPPRGGFLSFIDVTLGANDNNINPGFGQAPDDPEGNLRAEQQLLTAVADVSGQVPVEEIDAPSGGQYGAAFTTYLPDFNNGTELRFYYLNYHSRLPYASAFAGDESCLQSAPTGDTVTDTANLLADCPNADVAHFLGAVGNSTGGGPGGLATTVLGEVVNGLNQDQLPGATQPNGDPCPADAAPGSGPCAEAYPLDSFSVLLEYPEDINMYGISFNTSFGDISVQGEVAYRPDLPLQVDDIDVAFAALQPAAPVGCAAGAFTDNSGSCETATFDDRYAIGLPPLAGDLADTLANGGDLVGALGNLLGVDAGAAQGIVNQLTGSLANAGLDLNDLEAGLSGVADETVLSDPPGRRNAFPDYLTRYRGMDTVRPGQYIQGYERMDVLQYNLGATYVIGPGNWIKANQIILLFETGATHVPSLPDKGDLQIEGPGTFQHASVGNDGTGAPACPEGVVQGTSEERSGNTRLCGPFQLRFNPSQQTDGFADSFAWGYVIIGIVRYENVFPGISFEPVFIIKHDVQGTAPGPGENFIENRKMYVLNVEMRIQQRWSITAGVTFFEGADKYNYLADRDFFQIGLRYRF